MYLVRSFLFSALGLLACSASVVAQKSDKGRGNDEHDCDKAAKILARGKPQQKEVWAYSTISRCVGGAPLLAAA